MVFNLFRIEFSNQYLEVSFIRISKGIKDYELFGFFYNHGTIIIDVFFKEIVLRWNQ